MFQQLLSDAFVASLLWFPFVVAAGISVSYLKTIDVTIDGVAILSGIAGVFCWNATQSPMLSLLTCVLSGVCLSNFLPLARYFSGLDFIVSGVIVSILMQAASVIWVGESLPATPQSLSPLYSSVLNPALIVVLFVVGFTALFFRSSLGLRVRYAMDIQNKAGLAARHPGWEAFAGFSVVGLFIGLGSFGIVHAQGLARSGSGFEHLVVALTSYLAAFRLASAQTRKRHSLDSSLYDRPVQPLWLAVYSALGCFAFQLIVYLSIYYSPIPQAWRIIFALILFFSVANYRTAGASLRSISSSVVASFRENRVNGQSIEVRELGKVVGLGAAERCLFSHLSFSASIGLFCVSGMNGTGKSTLLDMIAGQTSADAGRIIIDGKDVTELAPSARAVTLVRQQSLDNFAYSLSMTDNLRVRCPALQKMNDERLAKELSEWLQSQGLYPWGRLLNARFLRGTPMILSGGEAKYLSLVAAIYSDRGVLLLDEPSANLDAVNEQRIYALIEMASRKRCVVVVTHDRHLLEIATQRIQITDYTGALVEQGA